MDTQNLDVTPYDPEEVVICPYFDQHQMPAKRLPYHLKKCHERYGGEEYVNCPMNRRHVVRQSELQTHLFECPNKDVVLKLTEEIPADFYEKQAKAEPSVVIDEGDEWGTVDASPKQENGDRPERAATPTEALQADVHPSLINSPVAFMYSLSEEVQEAILDAAALHLPNAQLRSMKDYKSLLNVCCQVSRAKTPAYYEVSDFKNRFGNYASKCTVFNHNFYSTKRCTTLMQSHQDAAKYALLYAYINCAPKAVYEEYAALLEQRTSAGKRQAAHESDVGQPAFKKMA